MQDTKIPQIAVVIPSYKVKNKLAEVVRKIGAEVSRIYVIDDCCPEHSGDYIKRSVDDPRLIVVRHDKNLGVGGAVMTGYRAAIDDGMDIIVKVDGDGQMDPSLILEFVAPIMEGEADYTKGNRFFDLESVRSMPKVRLFGNAVLSFMTKLSSGYWNLFDPTNGYTAIHAEVAKNLPFDKISQRYFFETDMLFRLNTIRAVAVDIPMEAHYADEVSGLKISKIVGEFAVKHLINSLKRVFYNYYLRDLSVASIELPVGFTLLTIGLIFGGYHWVHSARLGILTPTGTVMIAALAIMLGIQFLLAFLAADIQAVPTRPISRSLKKRRQSPL